jgi:hypothetical protein
VTHRSICATVPKGDHGHGIGQAISNGPAGLTIHIVLGLLLVLAAVGLVALIGAATQGASFDDQGHPSASMAMAVLTGVAILCYGFSLYILSSPGEPRA